MVRHEVAMADAVAGLPLAQRFAIIGSPVYFLLDRTGRAGPGVSLPQLPEINHPVKVTVLDD